MSQDYVKGVQIRELSVVISAKNHNPTILNPDFLERNGIVEPGWSLAAPPICVEPFAHVLYENGISVTSELDKLVFTQTGDILAQEQITVVDMAKRYVSHVPHVDYVGVGINPTGDLETRTEEGPRRYVMDNLIAPGPWLKYGTGPVRADVRFVFQLEDARLFLAVQEARRKTAGETEHPVIVFAANFHYDLAAVPRKDLIEALNVIMGGWPSCWSRYEALVNTVFAP